MQRHKSILAFVIVLVAVAIAVIIRIPPRLGLDLQGGSQLTIQVKTTDKIKEITAERLQDVLKIIENRVNGLGVSEALVQTSGDDQISETVLLYRVFAYEILAGLSPLKLFLLG